MPSDSSVAVEWATLLSLWRERQRALASHAAESLKLPALPLPNGGGDTAGDTDDDPFALHQRWLLALGVLEQIFVDLAHGDRERLLLQSGLDQRSDVLELCELHERLGGAIHASVQFVR